MDDYDILFCGFIVGVILASIVFLCAMGSSEFVNIQDFGTRLCESQGLLFDSYSWMKGEFRVPQIKCKAKDVSVYDGVVVRVNP